MGWGKNRTSKVRYKKNYFLFRLFAYLSILLVVTVVSVFLYKIVHKKIHNSNTVSALYDYWNKYDYQKVYEISSAILSESPLHTTAHIFHGYSSYFLAVAQTDNSLTEAYLKDALKSLRIALQRDNQAQKARIEYILGMTYFYKDITSNYQYYADLAVEYLLKAQKDGYAADDIPECLGQSYSALGELQKSVEAFGEALLVRESDTLLLAIAEQYYKLGNIQNSKAYLYRVKDVTRNEDLVLRTSFLLGQIYIEENELEKAEAEFRSILKKNENSADAHYGLGALYEKQGDNAKARAQWRRVLRIQPNHEGALKKLSDL